MEIKEKVGPVQSLLALKPFARNFGIKHVDMVEKMMIIKKKLLEGEQKSSVHYQPTLHVDGRSGYDRISSNLPFMQSVSQPFQSVRILKSLSGNNYLAISLNADHQYQQRKQSVELGNNNVPMNQCHETVRGFTQNSENALTQPRREMKYTSRGVGKYTDSESDSDDNTNNVNSGVAITSTKLAKSSKDAIFNNSNELNKFPQPGDYQSKVPEPKKSAHAFALIDDDCLFEASKSKSSTTKTDKKGKFEYDDGISRTISSISKTMPTHAPESTDQKRQLSNADTGSKRTKMKVPDDNVNSNATEVSTVDYRTRKHSNATSLASRMRKLRAQDLTSDDLAKLANVIQTMVKYRFPRAILLGDILEIMEKMEPRFLAMEQSLGITHSVFFKRYCPTVQTFGSLSNPNLILKEDNA
ncbi:hypothetical protein Ddc_02833 [Ditylenchus destructor]|nr:hypothetical protein Ddc_02833 [Ditylenchus destructor]